MARELPVWRSSLYVPVIVERFVGKAHERGADAIILDLEDSIPQAEKDRARDLVRGAVAKVGRGGADVTVRINRPWRQAIRDMEASVWPGVRALVLPKVADASHVAAIAEILDELEAERGLPPGSVGLVALVETAEAFFHLPAIARASRRLIGLTLGSEDFALSCGMTAEPDGLFYPTQHAAIAARAAGILPLGYVGSIADYSDLEAFRAMARQARRLGFRGGACVHPAQVSILNEAFTPTGEEVRQARGVVAAFEAALAQGLGAASFEGRMIDGPVVERARETLAIHGRLAASG